jgi:hypothetical protein
LNLRVHEEDNSVGLFKYFPTTTHEEHLKSAWTPLSWELESHEQDAHRVCVEGVKRDICQWEGNREQKQIQHAHEKAMKMATTNHTSNITPALPMTDLAEVSCPYHKIPRDARAHKPSVQPGHKRKHEDTVAVHVNWQHPLLWVNIAEAAV